MLHGMGHVWDIGFRPEVQWVSAGLKEDGSGLIDMYAKCRAAYLPVPVVGPVPGRVVQVVQRTVQVTTQVSTQVDALRASLLEDLAAALDAPTMQVTMQVATQVANMLRATETTPQKSAVLQDAMGLSSLEYFRRSYRTPLSQAGWLVRTDPASPNSPQQRYRLTSKGQAWLDTFNTLPKP